MNHQDNFDVIVVGAGQGGGPIASEFARAGRRTALIEREYAGGTCVNWGCTPTKTMIASGRVAYLARRSDDYGVQTGNVGIDMEKVRQRKREIVDSFRSGSQSGIDSTEGLTFIHGEARFVGHKTVSIALNDGGVQEMQAEIIILDVGERARPLQIDNPDNVRILNNRSVMELGEVPEHLIVVGGGPIGLEFAQLFRRLGAEVTVVHHSPQILSREDPDIADAVSEILREDGIHLEMNASLTAVVAGDNGLNATIERDGSAHTIRASHVVAAAGRVPNTDSLDLGRTGLKANDRGYLETNSRLKTSMAGIYAIGDVRTGPKFTHISYDDYRILRSNLLEGGSRSVDDRILSATTYIDPQLGRVGLSEKEAKKKGIPYLVASMPMASVARALETDETRGLIKILVHAESKRILGAAILGIEGGEIASMLQIAMLGDLPYTTLQNAVFAHPTLAESLNNVFGSLKEPEGA